jgi:predicted XRE-type DNA-binding protein
VRVESVKANNHKRVFELALGGREYPFPFVKADPIPTPEDPIVSMEIDHEAAYEGFIYRLASGAEGFVHGEQALDYNQDPDYMRDILLFELTVDANQRIARSGLSKREIIRRLDTSPAQFYRLIDTTNHTKTVDSMMTLLRILDCEIEVVVRDRTA